MSIKIKGNNNTIQFRPKVSRIFAERMAHWVYRAPSLHEATNRCISYLVEAGVIVEEP